MRPLPQHAALDRGVEPSAQRLVGVAGEHDEIARRIFKIFENAGAALRAAMLALDT